MDGRADRRVPIRRTRTRRPCGSTSTRAGTARSPRSGPARRSSRWFFRVGGAAGTVAKSISAYDMAVSDAVYGKADRYVSAGRLQGMLDKEFAAQRRAAGRRARRRQLLLRVRRHRGGAQLPGRQRVPRLDGREVPGPAARRAEPDRHARPDARRRGVACSRRRSASSASTCCYGAFFEHHEPDKLIESLLDRLTTGRIEIDMIQFRGIEFRGVDNRLMALKLVQLGLSGVAMFGPDREVLQPSEVLRKKAVLVERGSFRPPTHVNLDMLETAEAKFEADPAVAGKPVLHAHRDHHAQPAGRRGRRRPARLPGPGRTAGRLRHDRADHRLLRLLPAGRLHRASGPPSGSAS